MLPSHLLRAPVNKDDVDYVVTNVALPLNLSSINQSLLLGLYFSMLYCNASTQEIQYMNTRGSRFLDFFDFQFPTVCN
jgi:hypothetical protein